MIFKMINLINYHNLFGFGKIKEKFLKYFNNYEQKEFSCVESYEIANKLINLVFKDFNKLLIEFNYEDLIVRNYEIIENIYLVSYWFSHKFNDPQYFVYNQEYSTILKDMFNFIPYNKSLNNNKKFDEKKYVELVCLFRLFVQLNKVKLFSEKRFRNYLGLKINFLYDEPYFFLKTKVRLNMFRKEDMKQDKDDFEERDIDLNKLDKMLDTEYKKLNNYFKTKSKIRLVDITSILNIITHIEVDNNNLIHMNYEDLIKKIQYISKSKFNDDFTFDTIKKVLNLFIFEFNNEKSINKPIKNRFFIKPLVKLNNKILVGHQTLSNSISNFGNALMEGKGQYSIETIDKELKTIIIKIRKKDDDIFEDYCVKKVNNIFSKTRGNITKKDFNDLPGQIDILCVNETKNIIYLIECKKIISKTFNSEILNCLNSFIKSDGYINKLIKKEKFLKKNKKTILKKLFDINNSEQFKIKSYFLFPVRTIISESLKESNNIIYLSNLNKLK